MNNCCVLLFKTNSTLARARGDEYIFSVFSCNLRGQICNLAEMRYIGLLRLLCYYYYIDCYYIIRQCACLHLIIPKIVFMPKATTRESAYTNTNPGKSKSTERQIHAHCCGEFDNCVNFQKCARLLFKRA